MVAEMGFEPHDLRVMSPTSYRTALLRDIDLIAYIEYHSFLVLSIAIFTKSVDNLRGKQNAPGRWPRACI